MTDSENFFFQVLSDIEEFGIPIFKLNSAEVDCSFSDDDLLGRGSSMIVYNGYLKKSRNAIRAAVKLPKELNVPQITHAIRREIRMMHKLANHPNIVNLYGVAFKELTPVIVVEYGLSNIADYLYKR